MKLATGRGIRSFRKGVNSGSSRKAIILATINVIRNTRPKYSKAMQAANANYRT